MIHPETVLQKMADLFLKYVPLMWSVNQS